MQSIGYWDAKLNQNWGLDFHRNEGIEICLLESGTLDFEINNTVHRLGPNNLTITHPWILHKLGSPNISACKLHWFILDVGVRQPHQKWQWPDWIILQDTDLNRLTDILRRNEQPVWTVNSSLQQCFIEIGKLINTTNQTFIHSKLKVLINELLIQLLELFTFEKPILKDSLIESKRSVEIFLNNIENTVHENWTLASMADYCGLGTTQFSKYCRSLTNSSPSTYLNQVRTKKAKQMLDNYPEKTITSIAFDCGFSSNQYFTHVFKKYHHISPLAYREAIRKNH